MSRLKRQELTWSFGQRLWFRFLSLYLILSYFTPETYIGSRLFNAWLGDRYKALVVWVGHAVFGLNIAVYPNSSGDTTFNYVEIYTWVVLASAGALVWSILDRRPRGYSAELAWGHLILRYALAYILLGYGIIKVVPLQFGDLNTSMQARPLGHFTPMELLWAFMAASHPYTMVGGGLEVLSGLLLVWRKTAYLGALLATIVLTQVVLLNLCYDVPVKLFSMQLLFTAVLLIAPTLPEAMKFFESVLPRRLVDADRPIVNRVLEGVPVLVFSIFALVLLKPNLSAWNDYVFARQQDPLKGIWMVTDFIPAQDSSIANDKALVWNQLIIDTVAKDSSYARVVLPNEEDKTCQIKIEPVAKTVKFTPLEASGEKIREYEFAYDLPSPDRLVLTGLWNNRKVTVKLKLDSPQHWLLIDHGFHWISEQSGG